MHMTPIVKTIPPMNDEASKRLGGGGGNGGA